MPNVLDATGLTLETKADIISNLTIQFQNIYGSDIDLSSNTPDGQLINIIAQIIADKNDLLRDVYNSFDPDNAQGVPLWQRGALNGIQPKAGTYSTTDVTVTCSKSVNLNGIDQTAVQPFTIADNAGNQWQLVTSVTGLGAGSHVLSFQAVTIGAVRTTPNTINVIQTTVIGVTSVNNPTSQSSVGVNQETDAAFKIRRQKSVSLPSRGYLAGLIAGLESLDGVSFATAYENDTGSIDADGIPGHSVWAIVSGSALPEDIAQMIYIKRGGGEGMKGSQSYTVSTAVGSPFTARWDNVDLVNLFIFFKASSINGVNPPSVDLIREGLVTNFVPGVYDTVDANTLASSAREIDSNALITNQGFSDGTLQTWTLSGTAASGSFKISYNGLQTSSLSWNDTISFIELAVQALAGLENASLSGSIASKTIVFDLSSCPSVDALLFISDNTLQTAGSVSITASYDFYQALVMTPGIKNQQFLVSEQNIVITDILLLPSSSSIAALGTVNFSAQGGYGIYTYSLSINNSGGTIDASTGAYTAGSTPSVIDTVKVIDVIGNIKTVTVSVV